VLYYVRNIAIDAISPQPAELGVFACKFKSEKSENDRGKFTRGFKENIRGLLFYSVINLDFKIPVNQNTMNEPANHTHDDKRESRLT
jgi:hypothetical protein